jgi:Leucine-rich repeat (LRR) protein
VFPTPSIFTFERLQWVQMPVSQSPYIPAPGQLQGTLPQDLAFSTSLETLELYGNTFSGGLGMLSNLSGLKYLDLHFNHFDGQIPDLSLSTATLQYISLANNLLTGSIPPHFALMSNLGTLGLAHNHLSGSLDIVDSLKKLDVLYMRNNSFTGAMPTIPPNASVVDLDHNELTSFPRGVCSKPYPGAYANHGGCSQDWPNQKYDTCCLSHNMFNCSAGNPPACLANCGVECN